MAISYQSVASVEPFFAPLSRPLLLQALELEKELAEKEGRQPEALQLAYVRLHRKLMMPRQQTYELLEPLVKTGQFDTESLLDNLTQFTPKKTARPVSKESLSRWRDYGLIRYLDRGQPDLDSGAALITLRKMIQHRERGWLPSPPKGAEDHYFAREPLWYCWRQDSFSSPIVRCAVPLETEVPPSALLWTDWKGAAWQPEWLRLGELGCCRWAGTMRTTDALLWSMTEHDLTEKWGVPIDHVYQHALDVTPLTLHSLATSALLLFATERLQAMATYQFDALLLAG